MYLTVALMIGISLPHPYHQTKQHIETEINDQLTGRVEPRLPGHWNGDWQNQATQANVIKAEEFNKRIGKWQIPLQFQMSND
jgi:hypothetical protein